MLLDANVLLYAVHRKGRFHARARDWLTEQLNGSRRVGIPWQSLGNLVPDAQLAALALEHGLAVHSADTDFARFTEVEWRNPFADSGP